jgi:two-component system response regulator HydG/two-component system response regulator AtoC
MKVILLSRHPENFPVCQSYQPFKNPSSHPERSEGPLVLLSELDYQMLKALNVDGTPAIFILDYKSYLEETIDLLKSLLKYKEDAYAIVVNAPNEAEVAVNFLKAGAYHYFTQELNYECLCNLIDEISAKKPLKDKQIKDEIDEYFIGNSPKIQKIKEILPKVAETNCNVLIGGETGTGKELVARLIHKLSPRAKAPFVVIDCTTLQDTLFESEVFGFEKGAFTGAISSKKGLIELADGGTLFLDEIGDLSLSIQKKFLRFLQERTFTRLGSTKPIKVDVRIIAATNKNLKEEIIFGNFRADLYYRLNTVYLYLPPLRERKEDIPLIADHYLNLKKRELKKEIKGYTKEFMKKVMEYDWPGNVRELVNFIERAIILTGKDTISEELIEEYLELKKEDERIKQERYSEEGTKTILIEQDTKKINLVEIEKNLILETLIKNDWNQTKTAMDLGISRKQLITKMKKFGLFKERYHIRSKNPN